MSARDLASGGDPGLERGREPARAAARAGRGARRRWAGRGRCSTSTTARATARTRSIERLAAADPRVRGVSFRGNFGKAAALATGFRLARGEWVVTLDADLQDDPAELPKLIAALEGGLDLVSGWKQKRQDPFTKTLPVASSSTLVTSLGRGPAAARLQLRLQALPARGDRGDRGLRRAAPLPAGARALAGLPRGRGAGAAPRAPARPQQVRRGALRRTASSTCSAALHLDQRAQAAARLRPHRRCCSWSSAAGSRCGSWGSGPPASRCACARSCCSARAGACSGIQFILMGLLGEMIAHLRRALRLPGAAALQPGRPAHEGLHPRGRARHPAQAALRRPAQAAGAARRPAVPGAPARVAGRRTACATSCCARATARTQVRAALGDGARARRDARSTRWRTSRSAPAGRCGWRRASSTGPALVVNGDTLAACDPWALERARWERGRAGRGGALPRGGRRGPRARRAAAPAARIARFVEKDPAHAGAGVGERRALRLRAAAVAAPASPRRAAAFSLERDVLPALAAEGRLVGARGRRASSSTSARPRTGSGRSGGSAREDRLATSARARRCGSRSAAAAPTSRPIPRSTAAWCCRRPSTSTPTPRCARGATRG